MPRLQNPTSAVMSEKRRRQIAAVAEKYRLTVIEDDTYGFLSPERWPLARLIPHRTVFVTSLSKSLFPGMRLGCAVAPPGILDRIVASRVGDDDHDVLDWRRSPQRLDRRWDRRAHRRLEAARRGCASGDRQAGAERPAIPDPSVEPAHLAHSCLRGGRQRDSSRRRVLEASP